MLGFDYTQRIEPAALKAAGCQVAFRYLSNPGWPKNLTLAEANELLDAGIAIVLNYETTADFMLSGFAGGQRAAQSARSQARALMAPATTRIFYSADFNVSAAQVPTVLDFLSGASSQDGMGEVGDYGGLRMVLAAGAVGYPEWQTVAWSGGQWARNAVARQTGEQRTVGGVVVDVNEIMNFNALGAWTKGTSMSGVIPAGVRSLFPEVADQFQGSFDDSTAIIYGDAGSRASYVVAKATLAAVNALNARMDPNAIGAAVAAHLAGGGGASATDIAAAVAKLFGTKLNS
jgi:hypothetical protein